MKSIRGQLDDQVKYQPFKRIYPPLYIYLLLQDQLRNHILVSIWVPLYYQSKENNYEIYERSAL